MREEINKTILGERIKIYRLKKHLKVKDLAEMVGITPSALSMVETGRRGISMEVAKKIAKVFDVSVDYLLGNDDNPDPTLLKKILERTDKKSKSKESLLDRLHLKLICVYDGNDAGKDRFFPNDTLIQFFCAIPEKSAGSYGVIVHGDSMEPGIYDGDIVIVDRDQNVLNGKKGAVVVDGGVLVKRIYRQNGTVSLISDNPKYPPIVIKSSDFPVYLLGKVVWILKRES